MIIMIKKKIVYILLSLMTLGLFITFVNAKNNLPQVVTPAEVIFETNKGSFTLQLNAEKAPKTVQNFLQYVDEGFYNNTLFHRVIPHFMVQAGGFENGLKKKQPYTSVINESDNGLKNTRGTISMARTRDPDSATSQFFINLEHNLSLDYSGAKPGYTVFGKITAGMEVIDKIAKVPTKSLGFHKDVPQQDVVVLSARRKGATVTLVNEKKVNIAEEPFIAGEHYVVLDKPMVTRNSNKIEVVEMFSYGCPHCYEFEPLIQQWSKRQSDDVDFWHFPAVWNKPMELYAQAFYTAVELKIAEKIHLPLFAEIVIKQKKLNTESNLADFFAKYGVKSDDFTKTFKSIPVENQVKQAKERVQGYKPSGVPEIIVNGKYRIDRMRAGGMNEMLTVVEFLINKERGLLKHGY